VRDSLLALLLVSVAPLGCQLRERPQQVSVQPLPSPAETGSQEPFLFADSGGRIHMTWQEKRGDSLAAVRYAMFDGQAWSSPSTVVERADLFVNWADFPSVLVTGSGRIVVHWLQRSGESRYAYHVWVSHSDDGGRSWSPAEILHSDRSATEHGFASFFEIAPDTIAAVWLDGRATLGRRPMQLWSASWPLGSRPGNEIPLDTSVCDCCQTAAARTSSGAVVVYRDRADGEIRDIGVVRAIEGRWLPPQLVHRDGWKIDACPVNGPAVAARQSRVAVAWFTAADDTARVLVALSGDEGATFSAPIRVDAGYPIGRVDVELDAAGDAQVLWLERVGGDTAAILLRRVSFTGEVAPPLQLSRSSAVRASGFPRMAGSGSSLIAAWTDVSGPAPVVRVARIYLRVQGQ
jgi:hypothetical protein